MIGNACPPKPASSGESLTIRSLSRVRLLVDSGLVLRQSAQGTNPIAPCTPKNPLEAFSEKGSRRRLEYFR